MADIVFIALMIGLGIGLSFCCFCLYFISNCILNIRNSNIQEISTTNVPEIQTSNVLQIKIIENPMHISEDPSNN
jgi:hypothetical protein